MDEQRDTVERAARARVEGEIGDAEFLAAAAPRWRQSAARIWARFRRQLPAWVERADVEQELQVQLCRSIARYRLGSPMPPGAFAFWVAERRTRRVLHHWRGVGTHTEKGASRAEVCFSRAFPRAAELGEDPADRARYERASPEQEAAAREQFRAVVMRAGTEREALSLCALREVGGSAPDAAAFLWSDPELRALCGLRSEAGALRAVIEAATSAARREGRPDVRVDGETGAAIDGRVEAA